MIAPGIPSDLIWLLDSDPSCTSLYHQTLGLQYQIRSFHSTSEIESAISSSSDQVRLIVADPEHTNGSLADFFQARERALDDTSVPTKSPRIPDILVVSRQDDLELIRFFLRVGARDYLLKPLRPSELIAKIERALNQISNREIMILRSDLDGIQVDNLTFREHQILTVLLSRPQRSSSRDDLQDSVWNRVSVNRKTLDVHLFNLRRKLRPLGYDIVCSDQIFTLTKSR
jgi:DNA-binding response OmpR family regulator